MRRTLLAACVAFFPFGAMAAQADFSASASADQKAGQDGLIILAQDATWQAKSGQRPRPQTRPAGRPAYVGPGGRPPAGYRPGYRPPPPGYRPGYRPGGYYPGYRPPAYGWRPPYPGWRPGWNPNPWYGSYWRPGYGWATAAGIIAVGVLAASAAAAYSVPPPPNPSMCWFYTDQTYQTGYWAPCPPAP